MHVLVTLIAQTMRGYFPVFVVLGTRFMAKTVTVSVHVMSETHSDITN